jgi:hypothetical protein
MMYHVSFVHRDFFCALYLILLFQVILRPLSAVWSSMEKLIVLDKPDGMSLAFISIPPALIDRSPHQMSVFVVP